ncbi:hypothetical protein JAAARDRAFT_42031 [Jaapia argillacea MUCL 33604]|uniref:Dihydroorotate dehydrogenase (quinone), mitochondrial n=1 Tax=Jaapia argillacea MUCL 33604 TaxID=933084 RepID=A0A067PIW8_9AGAM|nr:hypothetical protein JAAARDRAFT_42031 [Jaapia argillacea MUCL 33604]
MSARRPGPLLALARLKSAPIPRLSSRSLSTGTHPPSSSNPVRTGLYATVFLVSTGLFAVYYLDARSAIHRYVITPVMRYSLDAETSHKLAVQILRSGLGPRDPKSDDEKLKVELWGHELSNPVGLAAGFDKDGEAIDGLFNLGFSWVEIGSVTPKPQPGNPKPRVFHLTSDSAMINRYGFPSQGHASVLARLLARLPSSSSPVTDRPASLREGSLLAVNLGKNKTSAMESIDDYVSGVRTFGKYADVLVVNVSSPNTPGLRGLQTRKLLDDLLTGVIKERDAISTPTHKPKLVLKIAPDLTESELVDIAHSVKSNGVDGVIISNTTIQRPPSLSDLNKVQIGGLSGTPLKPLTLKALRTLRAHLPPTIPLIGCGGISTGADALEYAKAGASFVQMYTSFGYDGVGACRRVKDQLVEELKKEGEGVGWTDVVKRSVTELSERGPVTVKQLIEEGEELKKVLGRFDDKMTKDAGKVGAVLTSHAAVTLEKQVQGRVVGLVEKTTGLVEKGKEQSEATVKQLILEGEELKKLLDLLDEKMTEDAGNQGLVGGLVEKTKGLVEKAKEEGEVTVRQLIEEGEDLKRKLDLLAEKLAKEADTIGKIHSDTTAIPPTAS